MPAVPSEQKTSQSATNGVAGPGYHFIRFICMHPDNSLERHEIVSARCTSTVCRNGVLILRLGEGKCYLILRI